MPSLVGLRVIQLSAMASSIRCSVKRRLNVDPAFLRHQTFDLAGEDLHAAAVADEDHDLVLLLLRASSSCDSALLST